ncbi:MAG: hypothetical protein H7175_12770 [Burkholderiales bacterium]|nr:hypothetical protein [Anaerolineae bacterium]
MKPRFIAALIVAFVLLPWGQTALAQNDNTLDTECRALMTDIPADTPDSPSIHIVQPTANSVVQGGQIVVTIETAGFDLSDGGHWHIWIDDQLRGMVYEPATVLDLAPGTYRLCAILGSAEHMEFGNPDGIMVTVEEPAPGVPTATVPVSANGTTPSAPLPEQRGLSAANLTVIVIGGLLAVVGGWWLGTRMGKRRLT